MLHRLVATEVRAALVAVLVARTAVNAGQRLVYPFLPEIARGLGVSFAVAGALLALRAAAALVAPLVPSATGAWGRRSVMLAGLAATAAGALLLAGASALAVAGAGFLLLGLAKPLFDIPMQAWFGARVPPARRGRVLGATEFTWALSLLLAVPAGFLIAAAGWRSLFLLIVVLAVLGAVAVARLIAVDRPSTPGVVRLRPNRSHVLLLGAVLLFRLAAELLFVVYGRWLEDDFGLSVAAIGLFTLVVVGAELAGEGGVTAFADRLGLRRTILVGLAASTLAYASLALVDASLAAAVAAVFAWFVAFEVTIVATVPFVTALGGEARERLLSLLAVVTVASGGLAALAAPQVYAAGGIGLTGFVAAGCAAGAALLVTRVPQPAG